MEDKINAGSKKENVLDTTNLADWLAYYQILIDDVKYAKQQQWRLAYYALLLFAAVVALSRHLDYKPSISGMCLAHDPSMPRKRVPLEA